MKKILVLTLSFVLMFTLVGCADTTELDNEIADLTDQVATLEGEKTTLTNEVATLGAEITALEAELLAAQLPELPDTVDMTNIDMYLGRPDVQYVDLRNFDDKMASGYIAGFEFIPFFDYLEYADVLVRTDGWNHATANIKNQAALFGLFDEDKTIFLMCGSGTRAGFVKSALEELGYTDVYNVGGISSYTGDNKVLGDGSFELNHPKAGSFTPGTHFAVDPQTQYTATIVVNETGYIVDVVFDAMYHGTTKNTLDTDYTLGSGKTWKAEAAELAAYVQANQGWGDIALDVTDITGMNMLTAPRHFIDIDHANSPDDVAGVTIGAEGFVLAWNLAIEMAGGTPIANVPTSQEWVDAHAPAYTYNDGVYFGDTEDGYTAKVTIEGGVITDVFFDALRVKSVINDNGTPTDYTDDYVEYTTFTTKQVLQEGYTLGSGFTWAYEADLMAAAILDVQTWDAAWVINVSTTGGHDYFDLAEPAVLCTQDDVDNSVLDAAGNVCVLDAVKVEAYAGDAYTTDALAGVTIGMEGFKEAYEEAIAQAIPAS